MRPMVTLRSEAESNFRTQGVKQPQRTQTRIFAMTVDEIQANSDTVTGIMFIFSILAWFSLILGSVGPL